MKQSDATFCVCKFKEIFYRLSFERKLRNAQKMKRGSTKQRVLEKRSKKLVLFTSGPRAPFSRHERGASDEVLIACGHEWFLQTLQKWPILWLDSSVLTANRPRLSAEHYSIEMDPEARAFIKTQAYTWLVPTRRWFCEQYKLFLSKADMCFAVFSCSHSRALIKVLQGYLWGSGGSLEESGLDDAKSCYARCSKRLRKAGSLM